ncbi:MAG: putative ABC exporter domain-containing protein [Acidobacteriota bacterium]
MKLARTFLFLIFSTARNRVLYRLRKLKQPRYLAGAIAGAAYFGFLFFRRGMNVHVRGGRLPFAFPVNDLVVTAGSLAALIILLAVWALPDSSGGLEFSEAEIQFLFPAPLKRREIILYKILRAQPQILFSALVFTVLGLRQGKFVGLWLAYAVIHVYFITVGLARARLRLAGVGFIQRLVAVLVILAGLAYAFYSYFSPAQWRRHLELFSSDPATALTRISDPLHSAVGLTILGVPRLFSAVALGAWGLPFLGSCAALIVFALLMFLAAARLDVAFEEASVKVSARKAEKESNKRVRRGGSIVIFRRLPVPFQLGPSGLPEVALIWKNLIAAGRGSLAAFLIAMVGSAVLATGAGFSRSHASGVLFSTAGSLLVIFGCIFVFVGPLTFRNDLRMDIRALEILKSYPLPGDRLVAAELAAPLILIFLVVVVMVAAGLLLLGGIGIEQQFGARFFRGSTMALALMFLGPVIAIQLVIRNAMVVLLPAWSVSSKEDERGVAAMGQRILMLIAQILALCVFLLPAAVVFAALFWLAFYFQSGELIMALAATPSVAILIVEIYFAIGFLGDQFDKIDVSSDLAAE